MIDIAPPRNKAAVNSEKRSTCLTILRKSSLLLAMILAFPSLASAESYEITEENCLVIDNKGDYRPFIRDGKSEEFSSLKINHEIEAQWNQYTIQISDGSFTVNGDTVGEVFAPRVKINPETGRPWDDSGTYLLASMDDSSVYLNGNVDLLVSHKFPEEQKQLDTIGANLLYARRNSSITVGNPSSQTKLWVLAGQPDLISAKDGGAVKILSTHNQLVGSIDTMDSHDIGDYGASEISITFSGSNSYWIGDEKSWQNSDYRFEYAAKDEEKDRIDLTFEDGAQWIYLGLHQYRDSSGKNLGWAIPKRISSITLNGGIINLHDETVVGYLKEIDLWDRLKNPQYGIESVTEYDYVRIGNLKGNGGIFRLDLNGEDKTQSDMVYIESGEGTHYFEPYNLQLLESITPENTLTFALVAEDEESSVQFRDKQNIYGQALVDYELEIAKEEGITEADLADPDNVYWDKTADIVIPDDQVLSEEAAEKIDMSDFIGGTNWFIRRVTLKESAAAVGMTGAGYASYDAAIEMDRRDRRLAEQVRDIENSDNGLWVRVHHGRSGAENQYRRDRTGATVGIDRQITRNNRLGAYFTYTQGDTEFLDVRGDGDMKRYELAVFDTLQLGQHYFDFVGRLGRVSSDFNVGNQSYSTSGDFDQDYAAVSAEYGYQLLDTNGVFIEPQLQVQVAYVDGYDYDSQRGMQVDVDSETSVIGRAGLRAGREITTSSSNGSFYARADVYHQFTDGQDAVFSDQQGHRLDVNWGDTDTWASFGVGTSWVWENRLGLQLDVEKVAGGKTEDTWLMSGRFSYLF